MKSILVQSEVLITDERWKSMYLTQKPFRLCSVPDGKSNLPKEYLSNAEVENDDEERERMGILVQY